jgi:hypothetical protein
MIHILVVAGNVASATGLVLQDAAIEVQSKGTSELASLDVTLPWGSNVDGGDLERSRGGSLAASRGSTLSQSRSGQGKDSERLHFQKID